jgi:type IV pilus assembly protein PilY1
MLSVLLRTIAIGLMLSTPTAYSANDIASSPINYLISAQVKPNIFFILDDSGSMQWSYLGDEVVINGYEKTVGYRNSLCNKIYYNPSIVYEPPEQADGTTYPAQNFTAALYDGFKSDSVAVDLSTRFTAWRTAIVRCPCHLPTSTINYRMETVRRTWCGVHIV